MVKMWRGYEMHETGGLGDIGECADTREEYDREGGSRLQHSYGSPGWWSHQHC